MESKSQTVLSGLQYKRLNRQPLDSEFVMNSYTDLLDHVEQKDYSETKKGSFYAGLVTSVVDDKDESKNGPYYISYVKTGPEEMQKISYQFDKIIRESDLESRLLSWGKIL